ncbi:hypothetical protein MRB53_011353 [Persea americana]|uniref:Uncharacterized protein n=1 Tax=Persea americana TaxID=3435 RepID=A0ACC2LVH6_PERAE|nr:hypothetical protein MRB53_011353 [Persea americana]
MSVDIKLLRQEELAISTFNEWPNHLEDTSPNVDHSFDGPKFSPENHDDELQHIGPSIDSAPPVANNIPSSELDEGPSVVATATPLAATKTSTTAVDTWHNDSLNSTTTVDDAHGVLHLAWLLMGNMGLSNRIPRITSKAAKQRRRAKKGLPKEQNCHPAEQIVGFGGPPAAQTGHAWFMWAPVRTVQTIISMDHMQTEGESPFLCLFPAPEETENRPSSPVKATSPGPPLFSEMGKTVRNHYRLLLRVRQSFQ